MAATVLAVIVLALGLATRSATNASAMNSDEQSMFQLTNQSRAQNGLGALQYDAGASNVARGWVQHLAAARALSHNPNLADEISAQDTDQWTRIGENVGDGPSAGDLQTAFMNSPGHRANVLGDFDRVGIASMRDSNGVMWVVLDFVRVPGTDAPTRSAPPSPAPAPAAPPAPPPIPQGSTIGDLDAVWRQPGSIGVDGWAIDPDTADPIPVHLYVDGQLAGVVTADLPRPDVGAAHADQGANHGYELALALPGGHHMLCAYAINSAGEGVNTTLGCASVDVADSPTGSLDDVQLRGDGIDVRGWSVDPDTASSTKVHLYIDGAWAGITDASDVRNDIAAALPGYGADHGYDTYLPVAPGGHAVCAYGINAAGTGTDSPLGCRYFIVTGDPVGNMDLASSPEPGSAHLVGWAFEPDAPNTTSDIHVYIDGGFAGVFRADSLRKDVSTLFGVGEDHGYDITLDVLRGTHSICTYAINAAGPGTNAQLGCRSVTVR